MPGERKGPGRPPGAGNKKKSTGGSTKKDDDDNSLALLITAGLQLLGHTMAQSRGPHWLPVMEQAHEIGQLTQKVLDKYFPASNLAKYSDEARLAFVIGSAAVPVIMGELALAQQKQEAQKGGQQHDGTADQQRAGGPTPVRPIRREREQQQPDGVHGVKHDLPALGPV